LVRDVFKEMLNMKQDDDIVLHENALKEDINRHQGLGNGPDPEELRLDMKGEVNSGWNSKAFQILCDKLKMKMEDCILPERSDGYLEELIRDKFKRLRVLWRAIQKLLFLLGVDGMSSEESATENDIETVYRVKILTWRRDIEKELRIINHKRMLDSEIF
ncbi:hypothetical protein K439DRAFT_1283732, partial [Ramaria rubella]